MPNSGSHLKGSLSAIDTFAGSKAACNTSILSVFYGV